MVHWLRHAFAIEPASAFAPTPDEARLVERLAVAVVRRGMATPAIMALECSHNLNFLASQTMVFFAPIFQALFSRTDYAVLTNFLERRGSIEYMSRRIEAIADGAEPLRFDPPADAEPKHDRKAR